MKVINETKADQESYVRFAREVTTLRNLGPQPGVLPMLDSHLPENPGKNDRAWLAMPIATPIEKALDGRSLQDVVAAVAAIAQTLARLQATTELRTVTSNRATSTSSTVSGSSATSAWLQCRVPRL